MRLELTHRGAYAIRAVLTLARQRDDGVVPARAIAREMDIPVRFLPQVLADLTRAGLVEARLGRSGGYRLTRDPARICLLEVIEAAEGDARRQTCVLSGRPCGSSAEPCSVHEVFTHAQMAILTRLADTTVGDILAHASFSDGVTGEERAGAPQAATGRAPVSQRKGILLLPPVGR
jgi:Rrf2 family protein